MSASVADMKNVVIFGTGGLGREVLFQIKEQNKVCCEYNVLGFADDNESLHGTEVSGYKVLGGSDFLIACPDEVSVVIAIGKPHIRKAVYDRISVNGNIDFPSLIAPNAVCAGSAKVGKGCIVGFFSCLSVDTVIGDFVLVSNGCNIGHDSSLGDFSSLYPSVHVSGNVFVGKGCEIGVGSNIIQGLTVGENTVIGAGAAVVRDIEGDCTAVGVPARVIKHNK